MDPQSHLPPGLHHYEAIAEDCRLGRRRFARIRAASGRVNWIIGVAPDTLARMRDAGRELGVGLILLGSRVSGPRLRQRDLHPALARALPLKTYARAASAVFPGVQNVEIDKTMIKELGVDDPRTSDLSILLTSTQPSAEMDRIAVELELRFARLGLTFPVRVFSRLNDRYHRDEDDFLATGERYLRALLSEPEAAAFDPADLRAAIAELYTTLNMPRRHPLTLADVGNGVVGGATLSLSFALSLGFHPSLPFIGFAFGLFGRYLSRMRAGVAFLLGDGLFANVLAMLFDAALGAAIMGWLIVPSTGLALGWRTIVLASGSHTLSKGALRLVLDKRFSTRRDSGQAFGVLATNLLNFAQGTLTGFVYAGAHWAWALQALSASIGLALLFGPIVRTLRSRR
jgi:hypothetical protein